VVDITAGTGPLFIRGGRIIDPVRGLDEVGDLLVIDGKVAWIGTGEPPVPFGGCPTISAQGMVVCPGFVDLHCHLREPGFEDKETIATGTMAGVRGGFTTLCCMPNTDPPIDNPAVVELVRSKAASEGAARVLPIGCISMGRKGGSLADMGGLAKAGVVAFSDDGNPVVNSHLMRFALEHGRLLDLPIIDHCEHPVISAGGVMNDGNVADTLGLKGIPAISEEAMVARDITLSELTRARMHIAHVSTARSVDLIRDAKWRGVPITAEATPHHLTLTEEEVIWLRCQAKVNPPLRTKNDTEALVRGLKDGVIDAIATDHAPHTLADKACDFGMAASGISGLETALGVLMGLAHQGRIDLVTLISRLTIRPARVIGKDDLGSLRIGAPADIAIFDPDREWTVNPAEFASKGKNTPWIGRTLRGKVMATLVGGEVAYYDDSIEFEGFRS
jgi:dihydroorotase